MQFSVSSYIGDGSAQRPHPVFLTLFAVMKLGLLWATQTSGLPTAASMAGWPSAGRMRWSRCGRRLARGAVMLALALIPCWRCMRSTCAGVSVEPFVLPRTMMFRLCLARTGGAKRLPRGCSPSR
ncbi:MAG: hypothetical protein ACLS7Z_10180 [Christensenellales bacterium]